MVYRFFDKKIGSGMHKQLDDNDILIYSTHSEGKLIVAERFIRTLKSKIYKKVTVNDNKSYLGYLNKLVDQCNNTYHCSISKTPIIDVNSSALTEKTDVTKFLNLNLVIKARLVSTKIFLEKVTPKISQEKYLLLILC